MITLKNTSQGSIAWFGMRGHRQVLPGQTLMVSETEYTADHLNQRPELEKVDLSETVQDTRTPVVESKEKEPLLEDFGEVVIPKHRPTIDEEPEKPSTKPTYGRRRKS